MFQSVTSQLKFGHKNYDLTGRVRFIVGVLLAMNLLYLLLLFALACLPQSGSFLSSYFRRTKLLSACALNIRTQLATKAGLSADNIEAIENVAIPCSLDSISSNYFNIGKVLGAHGVRGDVKLHLSSDYGGVHVNAGSKLYLKNVTGGAICPWTVAKSRVQGSVPSGIHIVRFENVHTRTAAELFIKHNIYVEQQTIRENMQANEYMVRDLVGLPCFHIRDLEIVTSEHTAASEKPADTTHTGPTNLFNTIQPIARVVGVVPPDELCSDPKVAHLMHAQLELQVFPVTSPSMPPNRAMRRLLARVSTNNSTITPTSATRSPDGSMECVLMPLVPSIVPVVDTQRGLIFLDPPEGLLDLTYEVKEKANAADFISAQNEKSSP